MLPTWTSGPTFSTETETLDEGQQAAKGVTVNDVFHINSVTDQLSDLGIMWLKDLPSQDEEVSK